MILKNASFRVKIFLIIFMAIFIPTVFVSTIVYIRSENAITDQTERTITSSMNFVIENVDASLKAINDLSGPILTDDRLTSIFTPNGSYVLADRTKQYSDLRDFLNTFSNRIKNTFMLNGIDSYYYLYIPGRKTIIDSKLTYYEHVDEDEAGFLQWLKKNKDRHAWFITAPYGANTLGYSTSRLSGDYLITYDTVLTGADGKTEAVLAINVDSNFITANLSEIQTGTLGEIIAVDSDGKVISRSDKSIVGEEAEKYDVINNKINAIKAREGSFFNLYENENDLVVYSSSPYTGWRYIAIIPTSQVLGQIWEIKKFLFIVVSIAAILLLMLTYLLSRIFYNPLKKLVSAMQMIENRNLDFRIDDNRGDEYHKVYRGFNDMVTELNRLIKDLVNEKILNKEAQIKLLQAQIHPHFLYNTLESIHSIAKIKKVDEIASMVSALSRFFRISLSGGRELVTLRNAIELALNYLKIQNIRFGGKIDYRINVPEDLMEAVVPKLILQPVVENAIYHGIEKKKGEGSLTISANVLSGILELTVEDNGIGMSEEKLSMLRKSIESDNFDDAENFALKNLNRQIILKYGSNFGISIESAEGEGTKTIIRLPAVFERGREI